MTDAAPIIKRREITYPRIEYRTGHLEVILPMDADEQEILERHKDWIQEKRKSIEEILSHAETLHYQTRTDEEFLSFIRHYAEKKMQTPLTIRIRTMKTKWASCSPKGTITINRQAKNLPAHHLEYIISHELLHLTNRKHNTAFIEALSSEFPDREEIEKDLCGYWFLLFHKNHNLCGISNI